MIDPPASHVQTAQSASKDPLREAAVALESLFLSEMLDAAGFGEPRGSMGGGAGEAQFSSFLRDAYAQELSAAGGIGLAETLYRSMLEDHS